jgi:hypothetical protein
MRGVKVRGSFGGSNRQGNLWIVEGWMWCGMVVPGERRALVVDFYRESLLGEI